MAPLRGKPGAGRVGKTRKKHMKRQTEEEERRDLEQRVVAEAPQRGTNPLASTGGPQLFSDLPISGRTKRGLERAGYTQMKEIQRACIPHLLAGRDVLGAAKTGSGKTLAFLVPMIEKLHRLCWSSSDGLGGLVVSPTRELAIQIFEVLRKVGAQHEISGGLVIGGKDVESEQERINNMNILVATPGRLLQHMDETYGFDACNLQVLVLDEADRILDMGFSATLNNIVSNLPATRQTCLFSATLTKSVRDLARLSMSKSPEYLSVHEAATYTTPSRLQQHYMIVDATEKLDVLWSFIKTHLKSKSMVFLSSCNQVRFVHDAFCHLRPGIPIAALHGKIKQEKRFQIFNDFVGRKEAVLICTDVAARGLDFPEVDWVVQVDCPEDTATYVHRVGRTARNDTKGKSLLLLLEKEAAMASMLNEARVPIKKIAVNRSQLSPLRDQLSQMLSQNTELKHIAQKAFVAYLRSVHLQSNKELFDVNALPHDALALAWGLPTLPRLRFVDSSAVKVKNVPYAIRDAEKEAGAEGAGDGGGEAAAGEGGGGGVQERERDELPAGRTRKIAEVQQNSKLTKLFNRKNQDVLSSTYRKYVDDEENKEGGSDDDIFQVSSRQAHLEMGEEDPAEAAQMARPRISKRSMKKIKAHGGGNGTRMVFDDEGTAVGALKAFGAGLDSDEEATPASNAARLQQQLAARDGEDKEEFRRRQKEAKLKLKEKLRKQMDKDKDSDSDGGEAPAPAASARSRRQAEESDSGEESSGDSESEEEVAPRKRKAESAGSVKSSASMSIQEQEDAALSMIMKRRRG